MSVTILKKEIQAELVRLGLASRDRDYGTLGGLDVVPEYRGKRGIVQLVDESEYTEFEGAALLSVLRGLPTPCDYDAFWRAVQEAGL